LAEARGRCIAETTGPDPGTMAAVGAGAADVAAALAGIADVWVANVNAPRQTVIAGTRPAVHRAVEQLQSRGFTARLISVGGAFHSPLVAPARSALAEVLDGT